MSASLSNIEVDRTSVTIDTQVDPTVPDENVLLEVESDVPGLVRERRTGARGRSVIEFPPTVACLQIGLKVVEDDGSITREYAFAHPKTGETGASSLAESRSDENGYGFAAGQPYDHSAIDHGPDGPVTDGDHPVPPFPATTADSLVPGGPSATVGAAAVSSAPTAADRPTTSDRKRTIIQWLLDNTNYDRSELGGMTKAQLLDLVDQA